MSADKRDFTITRLVSAGSLAEVVAVRCARLKVTRGRDKGREVLLGEKRSAVIGSDPGADLVVHDDSVSRRHLEVSFETNGYCVRDLGSTNGLRIDGVRVRDAVLDRKKAVLELGETEITFSYLDEEVQRDRSRQTSFGDVLGESAAMREMFSVLERVAASTTTVLIEGESGTGKERVAESLHKQSPRAAEPFVIIDCATIPPELAESELFGHEKGAFTGATTTRIGALAEASGGTVFFDEIGELPLDLQPKLLRVLEARRVKAVGSSRYRDIDVRVIAATNRDLKALADVGQFRVDLYYRLAVVKIVVPPLRQRLDDLHALARHFIRELRRDADPDQLLSRSVMAALSGYAWPGNVRELRNTIERLLSLGRLEGPIAVEPSPVDASYREARDRAIDSFERAYCRDLLARANGVVAKAADLAGLSRQMMYRLLAKHDLRED